MTHTSRLAFTRVFALDTHTRPRYSPYTFIANERGMADEPWWDGQAVYATMLRDPRHRTVSQYLHLRRYADAFLQVRLRARVDQTSMWMWSWLRKKSIEHA